MEANLKKKIIHLNDLDKSQTSFHLEEIKKNSLKKMETIFPLLHLPTHTAW